MKYIKSILLTLIIIFCINESYAVVNTTKISIKDAVSIASKSNLDIQSSRLNTNIEENSIKAANRFQNPEIDVFYNFGKAGKGNPQQIGASQKIEIGKRSARKSLSESVYELVKSNVKYLEFDLRMDVREAYTNLLAKKSILKTIQQKEQLLKNLLALTKELSFEGSVAETDVLQAQLLLNQIITEVNSANFDVKTAIFDFNKVINCPDSFYDTEEDSFTDSYKPLITPNVNLKMPEFDAISQDAINSRFDIIIAKQQINVAEKELAIILRERIPDIEIQGGYSYQNSSQSDDGTYRHGAYAGVNIVNIPILYTYKPEIANAKLKLEKAKLNYASVENKALNDLRKAYEKFLTAQLNLRNYDEKLLKNSEELINRSRKSYKEHKIDLTTLISMEESYRMISVAHTEALADYYNSWNEFIREVNNENFTIKGTSESL